MGKLGFVYLKRKKCGRKLLCLLRWYCREEVSLRLVILTTTPLIKYLPLKLV